jgi:hypothetical protein
MAWSDTFLGKNRNWWMRKIAKAQYYASTGTWYDGVISEKSISGDTITFKIQTNDAVAMTITKIRLIDADGDVAYDGDRSIVKSASEGALIQIDVPIMEE